MCDIALKLSVYRHTVHTCKTNGTFMPAVFDHFRSIPVALANDELALKLIADEAARLKVEQQRGRAAERARGLTGGEVDDLSPPSPASAFGSAR
jgi:hypothetical protein